MYDITSCTVSKHLLTTSWPSSQGLLHSDEFLALFLLIPPPRPLNTLHGTCWKAQFPDYREGQGSVGAHCSSAMGKF